MMQGDSFLEYRQILLKVDEDIKKITLRYIYKIGNEYSEEAKFQIDRVYENKKTVSKIMLGHRSLDRMPEKLMLTEEAEMLLKDLENYEDEIKHCYKDQVPYLWHISEKTGLNRICASKGCRDAYHNEILNAIFASSDYEGNLLFAARAAVGRVFVLCNEICIFPENPFTERGCLKKEISQYCISAEEFEPTFDYRYRNSQVDIAFSREWILRKSEIGCREFAIRQLPEEFFELYDCYYCSDKNNWDEICEDLYIAFNNGKRWILNRYVLNGALAKVE